MVPRRDQGWALVLQLALGVSLALGLGGVWSPVLASPSNAPPQPSVEALEAGRRLFLSGLGRGDAELVGQISRGVDLSGTAAACVKCHGADGGGSREAGLIAPSLRWEVLTRARPASGNGFGRAAYIETSLLQAIRTGVDASGRTLSAAMPRFMLGPREAADLMAYLRVLGSADDTRPGVHPDRIVFGTALPLSGPQAARGQAVRQAIQACFERAGREGAVFGRQLVLEAIDSAGERAAIELEALRARSLALVAPWWMRSELPEVMQPIRTGQEDWPVLAPLWPQPFGSGQWPGVYELQGQASDQARVLVDVVASRMKPGASVWVLAGQAPRQQAALRAAQAQAELYPSIQWVVPPAPPAEGIAAQTALPEAIVLLGGLELLKGVPGAQGPLYALSTELGRSVFQWPVDQRQRLWLAHAGPLGREFDASRLQEDFKAVGAALTDPALQAQAWAGACLAVEALRRAGRQPEGGALRRAMETVSRYETGVLPPISFSARHRQGIWGARMVILDARGQGFEEVVPWNTPREAY